METVEVRQMRYLENHKVHEMFTVRMRRWRQKQNPVSLSVVGNGFRGVIVWIFHRGYTMFVLQRLCETVAGSPPKKRTTQKDQTLNSGTRKNTFEVHTTSYSWQGLGYFRENNRVVAIARGFFLGVMLVSEGEPTTRSQSLKETLLISGTRYPTYAPQTVFKTYPLPLTGIRYLKVSSLIAERCQSARRVSTLGPVAVYQMVSERPTPRGRAESHINRPAPAEHG